MTPEKLDILFPDSNEIARLEPLTIETRGSEATNLTSVTVHETSETLESGKNIPVSPAEWNSEKFTRVG